MLFCVREVSKCVYSISRGGFRRYQAANKVGRSRVHLHTSVLVSDKDRGRLLALTPEPPLGTLNRAKRVTLAFAIHDSHFENWIDLGAVQRAARIDMAASPTPKNWQARDQ
jgi:hypothetical protein